MAASGRILWNLQERARIAVRAEGGDDEVTAHTSRSIEDRVLAAFLEPHYATVAAWRRKVQGHLAVLKSELPPGAIAWERVIAGAEADARRLDEAIAGFTDAAAGLGGEQSPAAHQLDELAGALRNLRFALDRTITLLHKRAP
jgi:hypothetical protein